MSQLHAQSHTDEDLAKVIAVVSYMTLIGWLISVYIYGQHKSCLARFHIRQSLGLIVTAAFLSFIPFVGWGLTFVLAIFWLIAAYHAFKGECYPVPILGQLFQEHLDFIT
ncbi:hypothetical protein [Thalassotalea atypica]|uniref:hypothetical protein n=1 Tax=Thalassotalea atypica TaxID=2054316 RepID=UPI002572C57C|nr:hypothetical protein [Thalassotalea atypica]